MKNLSKFERGLETAIFQSRWLIAPIYIGLIVVLAALVLVFLRDMVVGLSHIYSMTATDIIMLSLSLVDLSLAGNLLIVVMFSGYENFVSKIESATPHQDRPAWMGSVDFSALKVKLFSTIVAISAIALLKAFISISEGRDIPTQTLAWLVGIHATFVASSVLMSLIATRHKQ